MPYIKAEDRPSLDRALVYLKQLNSGELAYVITRLILESRVNPTNYEEFCTVIGLLETVKLEIQRRLVAPYERMKMSLNGDVF